jgi:hypothetical protein
MNAFIKLEIASLCGLLLLSAACGGPSSSTGNAPMNPVTAGADPHGELTKAMSAMLAAKSYRSRMQSSSSSGINGTTLVEFSAPDRFHLTREATLPGRGPSKQETIIIGNDTWMKMGDAPWQKFPANLGEMITQLRNPKAVEELAKATEVKFIGPDVLDGSPAMVYQYTLNDIEGKGFKNTAKTWVGVTDNLPRKTESETEMNITGKQTDTKTTVTYYDYGAVIKIEPPM